MGRERTFTALIGTTTKVAASATVVNLLAASNGSRLGAAIYSDPGSADLKIKMGTAAAADDYSVLLSAGDYFEVPSGYIGAVTGIWTAATGAARVTEFT